MSQQGQRAGRRKWPYWDWRRLPSGRRVAYAFTKEHPKGVTLGTEDPREAEQHFRALLAGPGPDGEPRTAPPEVTLAQLEEHWLDAPLPWTRQTKRTARNRVRAFLAWCDAHGARYPSELTAARLDDWVRDRRAVATHRTINRDLRCVRGMVAWGAERGHCDVPPALAAWQELREARRQARHVVPDPAEMACVLAQLAALDARAGARNVGLAAPAVAAIYASGLRIDELRRLGPGDLHDGALHQRPEEGAADTAEPGKGYRERAIPLHDDAQAVLRRFFAATRGRARAFSESWLVKLLHRASEACTPKVPCFGLHDVRRAFATEAHRGGVPIGVISRWLGHADVRTTELYIAEYRSDRSVLAPVPAPLAARADIVRSAGVISGPLGSRAFSGGDEKSPENQSRPSDLNRRPAVYEGATTTRNDKGNAMPSPHRADTGPLTGEAWAYDWHDRALLAEAAEGVDAWH